MSVAELCRYASPAQESPLERARARRDALDWAIREQARNLCEDCGRSLKGLAVFDCSGPAAPGMFCCSSCATTVVEVRGSDGVTVGFAPERPCRWARVELAREGRSVSSDRVRLCPYPALLVLAAAALGAVK